jgi:hypothetical protein
VAVMEKLLVMIGKLVVIVEELRAKEDIQKIMENIVRTENVLIRVVTVVR